ncbi:transporter [Mucilaginibacter sp. RS28]|uniref:Transporter n=1 Tax=Mucilaginibacter straminoryzae TaxID=2932774 RepID=A0A9X1XBR5_9SPHI|nr:transporter [Mucilaginibacter straminoryzae]MCJ8211849.1 transporter [Mucilaginibacter straminoryzae]
MKQLYSCFLKERLALIPALLFILVSSRVNAQTESDALMIPKNYLCVDAMYSYSSWDHYWEGTFKRNNLNLGTVSTNMYGLMLNYGITNNLNIIAGAPYVTTHASAGTLAGMKGVQDLTATIKWRALTFRSGNNRISAFAIGSGVLPLTNYVSDFLPMSIGLHARSVMLRGMIDYQFKHFFVTGSGMYNLRDNITIDRDAYYTTTMVYSNQVDMPNVRSFNARLGYRSSAFIAEAMIENNTTLGGFDIRKNDMPFPSNKMNATAAGVNFKYSLKSGFEFMVGGSRVLAGRNVGQSNMIHGGVNYLFSLKGKNNKQSQSKPQQKS